MADPRASPGARHTAPFDGAFRAPLEHSDDVRLARAHVAACMERLEEQRRITHALGWVELELRTAGLNGGELERTKKAKHEAEQKQQALQAELNEAVRFSESVLREHERQAFKQALRVVRPWVLR